MNGLATKTDREYGRVQIITNGLFISRKHLEALLEYKNYITFVVSVDLGHHNGSKCETKYVSLVELCESGHQNECLYFKTIFASIVLMQEMGFSLMINVVQKENDESQQDLLKALSSMLNVEEDHIWIGTAVQDKNIKGMPTEKTAKVRDCQEDAVMFITKKLSQSNYLLYLYFNFVSQRKNEPAGYLTVSS